MRSEYLIYGILFFLPSYLLRFSVFGIRLNVLDCIIAVSFLYFLSKDYKRIALGEWKYIIGSFVIIGAIAVLVSSDQMAALGLYKSFIIAPILVGIMILTCRPSLQKILAVLGLQMFLLSIVGAIQYMTGIGIPAPWNVRGDEFRITSIYEYPNAVGLLFAPIVAMMFAWAMHVKTQRKIWIQLSVIAVLIIAAAKTEGAVIAIVAAVVFSLTFTKWKWWAIGTSVVAICIALAWEPTRSIILLQNTSGEVRLALWQGTIALLSDNPLFGAGLAGFPQLYAEYKLDRHVELLLYPHNLVLDFWVTLGLAGLIWLVAVIVKFFRDLLGRQNPENIVLMSGMVAILVYGLVDVPYFKNDLSVLFWTIITMATVLRVRQGNKTA